MIDLRTVAFVIIFTSLIIPPAGAAPVQDEDALYRAEAIVTGTEEAERLKGFRLGAQEVLIKLTGRPAVTTTERAQTVIDRAPELIAEHSYEDRMKDLPVRDEQGTRERPHFLRMRFDPQKFDQALDEARIAKWNGKRPTVAVWIGIREARGRYILSANGEDGYAQREVLKEASKRRAIPIILPKADQEEVTFRNIERDNWSALLNASTKRGATAVLYGTLEYDGDAHWDSQWVAAGGRAYRKWEANGVTFDQALKGAIDRIMTAYAEADE